MYIYIYIHSEQKYGENDNAMMNCLRTIPKARYCTKRYCRKNTDVGRIRVEEAIESL